MPCCLRKKVSTPDEMLDVVKEKENISAEVDMIECGRIVDNDTTIVVGMTGENDKTYHYYAAQFSKNQDGKYKYKNAISLNDIGWQLRLGKLNTGYIIVCNNENVSTIQAVISPRNGADITKNIEINNIPFVYYLDMSNIPSDYDIQYKFLNENGEEIYSEYEAPTEKHFSQCYYIIKISVLGIILRSFYFVINTCCICQPKIRSTAH